MQTYLVPEKWMPMWRTMSKGIVDAQDWALKAHLAKDEGKMRLYGQMVSDRIMAMSNLQRLAFGDVLERISKERGRVAVHTMIQEDPPGMVVFDNDQEYYTESESFKKDVERDGEGVQTHLYTSLQKPVTPMNPEGAD